jgi:hypothetical protein
VASDAAPAALDGRAAIAMSVMKWRCGEEVSSDDVRHVGVAKLGFVFRLRIPGTVEP